MNLEQIAPCPFCGKSETVDLVDSDTFQDLMPWDVEPEGNMLYWAVMCDASKPDGKGGCGASGGFMPTQEAAVERWNARPDSDYKARALSYESANMEQGKMLNEVIKERDELRKDAERYRWLRDAECLSASWMMLAGDALDAAIDAAIAKSKPADSTCHATETLCSTCNNDFRKCTAVKP